MTNTNNFVVRKILPIDNPTPFSKFKYSINHTEMPWIQSLHSSSCIWIKKKSKLHITMKSLKTFNTSYQTGTTISSETADLCRFSSLRTPFIQLLKTS